MTNYCIGAHSLSLSLSLSLSSRAQLEHYRTGDDRPQTTLDRIGPYGTASNHIGTRWTASDRIRPYGTASDHIAPHRNTLDRIRPTSDHIRSHWAMWDCIGPHRTTLDLNWAPDCHMTHRDSFPPQKCLCLITQTCGRSPSNLTDRRGGRFFFNWL